MRLKSSQQLVELQIYLFVCVQQQHTPDSPALQLSTAWLGEEGFVVVLGLAHQHLYPSGWVPEQEYLSHH